MATIKLIVTGDMEKSTLALSLQKLFPAQRINAQGQQEPVTWAEARKLNCATSHRLKALSNNHPPSTTMAALVQAMFDEVQTGKNGVPADLVIVIDDVELGNIGQEHLVAQHFRAAVDQQLAKASTHATEQKQRAILREKCSFHLLKPMVESYLFGDPQALKAAGLASNTQPKLRHHTDVEAFESADPLWLPTCTAENFRRQPNKPWWRHEQHPKHYLEHLTEKSGIFYDETKYGKDGLAQLDWRVVAKTGSDIAIVRALLEDLADWFGVANPMPRQGIPDPFFYPAKNVNRNALLLRNM